MSSAERRLAGAAAPSRSVTVLLVPVGSGDAVAGPCSGELLCPLRSLVTLPVTLPHPAGGALGRLFTNSAVLREQGGAARGPCGMRSLRQPRWLPSHRWKTRIQRWRALPAAEVDGLVGRLHPISITPLSSLQPCPEPHGLVPLVLRLTKPCSWPPPCRVLHQHGGKEMPGMTSRLRFAGLLKLL